MLLNNLKTFAVKRYSGNKKGSEYTDGKKTKSDTHTHIEVDEDTEYNEQFRVATLNCRGFV